MDKHFFEKLGVGKKDKDDVPDWRMQMMNVGNDVTWAYESFTGMFQGSSGNRMNVRVVSCTIAFVGIDMDLAVFRGAPPWICLYS